MKASEFRIGNIIYQGDSFGEVAMNAYDLFNYHNFELKKPSAHYCETWKPISLTRARLVEFGFQKIQDGFKHEIFSFKIKREGSNWLIQLSCNSDILTLATIQHVHQLQNLCFALEGKELLPRQAINK